MANTPISAGVKNTVMYGVETTYGTEASVTAQFGLSQNFSANKSNQLQGHRSFKGSTTSGRDIQKYTTGTANIELSTNFVFNNADVWTHILGDISTSTYSGDDLPSSMTIINAMDNVTTDRNEVYTGCVVNSATISGAENEPITGSLSIIASDLSYDSTLDSSIDPETTSPYNFVSSTFELPNSTAINNIVTGFELTVNNNMTLHYGNSRTATAYTAGNREYSLSLNTTYVEDDLLNKALGGTSFQDTGPSRNASLEIVLENKDGDTMTLLFGVTPIESHNLTSEINNPVKEDITLTPASLTVTTA